MGGNDLTDIKAKSRHFVLRFLNVKDEAHRLAFAPTDKMLADGLTKFTTANVIQMLQPLHTSCYFNFVNVALRSRSHFSQATKKKNELRINLSFLSEVTSRQ